MDQAPAPARENRKPWRHRLLLAWAAAVFAFLYLPVLVLAAYSFNSARFGTGWQGWTLRWYAALFRDASLLEALKNSLIIAVVTTLLATVLPCPEGAVTLRTRWCSSTSSCDRRSAA